MKVFALIAFLTSSLAYGQAKTWEVDSMHASVVFKINHMGFSNVQGTFSGLEGKINLDESKAEKSSFDLKVPAASLSTNNTKRDDHVRGPDFLNVKQFPMIELKSKSMKKVGDKYEVVADMTLHGVTKPVNFTLTRFKTGKGPMGEQRTGGEAMFKIKRSDFGVNFMAGAIGDDVELTIDLEAIQK